jgi:hypothetical protein
MPRVTFPKPTSLFIVSFVSACCILGAACSGGGGDGASSTGGSGATGGMDPAFTGGAGPGATGGTGAAVNGSTGGQQACIPANPNGPADHATAGYDSQPCSACHAQAYTGGFVYDTSLVTTVPQATVTVTPTGGAALTAVTGSTGMFYFPGIIPAPYEVCVSKCPDTVCSTATDHPNSGDCGTCHGVTTTKIHLP